jgi:hypothetical protein
MKHCFINNFRVNALVSSVSATFKKFCICALNVDLTFAPHTQYSQNPANNV